MGLTNSRDTTISRLRVQPVDQRGDDDLFGVPLWPALFAPAALTFVGIYSATVSAALNLAAETASTLVLDGVAAAPDGTYIAIPFSGAPAGLVFDPKLGYSGGKLEVGVTNATSAAINTAAATAIKFLIFRVDTGE